MRSRSTLRLTWQLLEGQRLRYGAAIAALSVASCFLYLVPLVPQIVIDGALTDDPEAGSAFVRRAVDVLGGREAIAGGLHWALVAVAGLTAISGVFTYLRARWSAVASERIAERVRNRLYEHLQHLPMSFFDDAETGDLVQRCTSDVETLRQFLASQVVELGRATFMMLVPIPLMMMLDVRMTLVSIVLLPVVFVFSLLFFRRVRASFQEVDEAEGRLTSRLQENLTGIRVVRAFARQDHEIDRFAERNAEHRDLDFVLYRLMAWYWSVSDVLCMGQKALVVGVGAFWLMNGSLQVGTFYFFLAAVSMFVWPIRMMGRILTQLGKALVAIGRIDDILSAPRERDPEAPVSIGDVTDGAPLGALVFEDVSFRYGEGPWALEDVSFSIRPGETVALLGPSGAGKSTIVRLALRLYDPTRGRVILDGVDLGLVPRKRARSEIAVIMQEPFLYSKTLRENVRLGRKGASDSEIEDAARVACVHDSIMEFDLGYETVVGERGVTLSGGQRQRVALARALLDRPRVLILDDALSAVDTETEKLILEALESRRGERTTLLIAHRLSTLMHADRILVIENGRIVQEGPHRDLIAERGLYRRLWTIQSTLETEVGIEDEALHELDADHAAMTGAAHDAAMDDATDAAVMDDTTTDARMSVARTNP